MLSQLWERLTRNLDPFLLAVASLLVGLGLLVLYSATGESLARVGSQAGKVALGFLLMWALASVPPQVLSRVSVPLYVLGVVLLIGVAFFGVVINGARRWLNFGFGQLQPSEILKLAVPLVLAWYFDKHEASLRPRDFLIAAALVALPFLLIARQPDLGTALLIGFAGVYVLFFAGLRWRTMTLFAVVVAAALPLLWKLMHDYQRDRILTLFDPSRDPLGDGYHITQSTIALGSGGLIGKGWLQGTQTHLEFLPERHTDFIFAVYGEEFGLIGNLVLVTLYVLLIGRGLYISAQASTLFGRLLGGAISLSIFTYAFVNIGMVSGVLPVVGVPLPFVSYGGTAMLTLFICLGMLMSIRAHRKLVQT